MQYNIKNIQHKSLEQVNSYIEMIQENKVPYIHLLLLQFTKEHKGENVNFEAGLTILFFQNYPFKALKS